MRVKVVMKINVGFCLAEDSLMKAAEMMRSRDCGVVPIVDADKKIVGMLTDRDLCLAVVARNRKASDVKCGELIGDQTIVCAPDDKLEDALKKMRKHQIKRLAAVGKNGEIVGILTIADILLHVLKDKNLKKKIYTTLRAIYKPLPIVLREVSADTESGKVEK